MPQMEIRPHDHGWFISRHSTQLVVLLSPHTPIFAYTSMNSMTNNTDLMASLGSALGAMMSGVSDDRVSNGNAECKPMFDRAVRGRVDFLDFVMDYIKYARLQNWDQDRMLSELPHHLTGTALHYYESKMRTGDGDAHLLGRDPLAAPVAVANKDTKHAWTKWNDFVTDMKRRQEFHDPQYLNDRTVELLTMRYHDGMDMHTHVRTVTDLCLLVRPECDTEYRVHALLRTLPDDLAREVLMTLNVSSNDVYKSKDTLAKLVRAMVALAGAHRTAPSMTGEMVMMAIPTELHNMRDMSNMLAHMSGAGGPVRKTGCAMRCRCSRTMTSGGQVSEDCHCGVDCAC